MSAARVSNPYYNFSVQQTRSTRVECVCCTNFWKVFVAREPTVTSRRCLLHGAFQLCTLTAITHALLLHVLILLSVEEPPVNASSWKWYIASGCGVYLRGAWVT